MKNKKNNKLIINRIKDYYNKELDSITKIATKDNSGGEIRARMGAMGEKIPKLIWKYVGKEYNLEHDIRKGETDKILCENINGNTILKQVDKHCYINYMLKLIIECKCWLDASMMERASSDFRLIKKYTDNDIKSIIVSLENATSEKSEMFILDEGHVDKVFYLLDGKRRSDKPIWKKDCRKKINDKKLNNLINYIRTFHGG